MQQLHATRVTHPLFDKDRVLDDLVARIAARRSLAARRGAAYCHLARLVLDEDVLLRQISRVQTIDVGALVAVA